MLNSIRSRLRPSSHGVVFFLRTPNPSPPKYLSTSTTTTTTTTTTINSQTLNYLIDSCGLSPESAISASQKKLHLKSTENPNAVLRLFSDYGIGKSNVSKIITKLPALLTCDPHKILKPKLDFFRSVGFSGENLSRLITLSPLLLRRSLDDHLIPCFSFLRTLLHSDDNIVSIFSHAPHPLNSNLVRTIMPSLEVLRKHMGSRGHENVSIPCPRTGSAEFQYLVGTQVSEFGPELDSISKFEFRNHKFPFGNQKRSWGISPNPSNQTQA